MPSSPGLIPGRLALPGLFHVVSQQPEGAVFGLRSGLVDEDPQFIELSQDIPGRQEGGTAGEDRRLQHGVAGTVESQQVPEPFAVDHPAADAGPLFAVVELLYPELVEAGSTYEQVVDNRAWA